jgi:branched-chain amino acid transport system substrate-binding protein
VAVSALSAVPQIVFCSDFLPYLEETGMTFLNRFTKTLRTALAVTAVAAAVAVPSLAQAQAKEQYFGIPSYRVGPFAAGGTGFFGGIIDYLQYVNMKDGGVNGVQLTWTECETEYNAARGVECYQRLLKKGSQQMHIFEPLATPIAYGVLNRVDDDKVVLTQYGYGRSDAADGRVFPWVFATMTSYWSQASAIMNWISTKEGGVAKMRDKKIVHLHLDSAFGREPLPVLRRLAKDWGFELIEVPVAAPGIEQSAQWLRIRQANPDWVISWGFGAGMNSTSITNAARINFPRDKMVGVWWAGSEEDVIPAGEAAKGYYAAANVPNGKTFPLVTDIEKVVYGAGKGNLADPKRIGNIYWNRGVTAGLFWVEAVRNGQRIANKPGQVLNGDEMRAGFESLNLTPQRLTDLGISGMLPPFKLSCADHEGAGVIKIIQWDGAKWVSVTPNWVSSDRKMIREMVEESAAKYAVEQKVTPRACSS